MIRRVRYYINWLGELWMGPMPLGEYVRFEGFNDHGVVWVPWPFDEYDNALEGHGMEKPMMHIPMRDGRGRPECWSECPVERARRVVERFYKETVGT